MRINIATAFRDLELEVTFLLLKISRFVMTNLIQEKLKCSGIYFFKSNYSYDS